MSECFDLLLTSAEAVLPSPESPHGLQIQLCDIGIKKGKIAAIGDLRGSKSSRVESMKGLYVLPGVIDSQVHFREPGMTHKEDLKTGSEGALLGGVTAFFEMPNTQPPTATVEALEEKLQLASGRSYCHYGFFAGATPQNSDLLTELEKHAGCVGIKIFMGSSTGSLLVDEEEALIRILKQGRRRVAVHSEDEARMKERKAFAVEGGHARFHPIWRDEESAVLSTQRLIRTSLATRRPVHVLHVSTAEELELIKPHRPHMTIEVLPQHLIFAAPEVYEKWGNFAQQNPPIRSIRHREALWQALSQNIIDVIGSDHAPHTREEKAKPYPQSPSGMPGTQTMLALMLNFVNQQKISLEQVTKLLSSNPARLYGAQDKGCLRVGGDADFTIIDLKKTHTISNQEIKSKSGWCLYDGLKVQGWPIQVYLKGNLAMQDGEILGLPQGQRMDFI